MAYIEIDGKYTTLRSVFRLMPPTTHHIDPSKSLVLAYIQKTLGCSFERAVLAFNSMRNPTSRVMLYDRANAVWRGCDWMPEDEAERETEANRNIRNLDKITRMIRSETRKINNEIDNIVGRLKQLEETIKGITVTAGPDPGYNPKLIEARLSTIEEQLEKDRKSDLMMNNAYNSAFDAIEERLNALDGGSVPKAVES